ncbi:venom metalloproteinase antarease-like TtrivMP_A [Dermacentor silvarum]|uniref:venom metalloproteinase antarease-like TtrivMP_A n=1 Tax=Dermacentor silvarum TaxID=543639 RepID=UPI00189C1DF5|nr:venom metalloproteinase antarease-like TtrivMP_A [Dermacentor silvarum]
MIQSALSCLVVFFAVVHAKTAATIVYPRMLESRSEDDAKIVKISDDITLTLRKSSIFAEEFLIHSTRDGVPIAYHMRGPEMEKNLYHDADQMASVDLSEEGGISIEGVLGGNLRIKPVEGMERSEDGQVAHQLYEVENTHEHGHNHDDYAVPNITTRALPESRLNWPTGLRIPVLIRPEVYVVVDYEISSALKFQEKRIAQYIAILGNSANLRYRSMVQPRVQLTIVGITVTTRRSDESYMVEISGYQATKNINYGQTIDNFKNFVAQKSYFATSDIIFLLTGKNMSYWDNKELKHSIGGFAYLAGACTQWRVGMTEERVGSYYGVFVFAHELAHSLGCVHDGATASSWPNGHIGSADCPYDNGYMMSYKFTKPYMYKFSSCCQREVMNIYNRPAYECLSVKNAIKPGLHSSKFPGEVSSRETYCKKVYSSYSYVSADKKYNMSRCIVRCFISRNGDNMLIGAVDGVSCGRKKMCVLGNCTSRPPIDKAE